MEVSGNIDEVDFKIMGEALEMVIFP